MSHLAVASFEVAHSIIVFNELVQDPATLDLDMNKLIFKADFCSKFTAKPFCTYRRLSGLFPLPLAHCQL